MTQKDKLRKADMMAMRIKSIATRLESEARDYDVRFPIGYANDLKKIAEDFLKS